MTANSPSRAAKCCAHWLTRDLIVWKLTSAEAETIEQRRECTFSLHSVLDDDCDATAIGAEMRSAVPLTVKPSDNFRDAVRERWPHLCDDSIGLSPGRTISRDELDRLLRTRLTITSSKPSTSNRTAAHLRMQKCLSGGNNAEESGLQLAGVLDECYTYLPMPLLSCTAASRSTCERTGMAVNLA